MYKNKIFHNESTKIYTEESFLEFGKILLQLAKRGQAPLLMAKLKIKNYEELLNTYGQPTADKILELITDRVQQKCRTSDMIAYLGEGKIGILFYNITVQNAKHTLNGLAEDLIKKSYEINGKSIPLSFNMGGSIMFNRTNAVDLETLKAQTLVSLQNSEREGDNTIIIY